MLRQTIRSNLSGMRQEILGTVHPNAQLNGQPAFSVIVADLKVPALPPCLSSLSIKFQMFDESGGSA
jgi:hypothetical protein